VKPFIVFEGIDGAGTTTHSKALVERLNAKGIPAVWTCEPTKTPVGTFIREIFERKHGDVLPTWRAMALLFQADREQHCHEIAKWRETHIVVCDRFVLSTMVYQPLQGLIERGLLTLDNLEAMLKSERLNEDIIWVMSLNEHLSQWPDLTFLLDVPVEEAILRKKEKRTDLFEHRLMWEASRKQYLIAESRVQIDLISTALPKEEVVAKIDERMIEFGV
jgi:dTMP kinase